MFDSYGIKQIYLVEPEKIDWGLDSAGGPYKTYTTCSGIGVSGYCAGQMNHENAFRFAQYNDMEIITQDRHIKILEENYSDEPWPEELDINLDE